jgi:hypothetical protein
MKDGLTVESREVEIIEKLWNRGKHIGEVRVLLSVFIPQFFRQMIVYVRSEHGIQTITPFYSTTLEKGQCP